MLEPVHILVPKGIRTEYIYSYIAFFTSRDEQKHLTLAKPQTYEKTKAVFRLKSK